MLIELLVHKQNNILSNQAHASMHFFFRLLMYQTMCGSGRMVAGAPWNAIAVRAQVRNPFPPPLRSAADTKRWTRFIIGLVSASAFFPSPRTSQRKFTRPRRTASKTALRGKRAPVFEQNPTPTLLWLCLAANGPHTNQCRAPMDDCPAGPTPLSG